MHEIDKGSEICKNCGTRNKNKIRKSLFYYYLAICYILIIGIFAIFAVFLNKKVENNPNKTKVQEIIQKNTEDIYKQTTLKRIGKVYNMKSGKGLKSAIATSKYYWKSFKNSILNDDKAEVIQMMSDGRIIAIKNGSKVKYLGELKAFSHVAKIKILEGDWTGTIGYTFENNLY